MFSSGIFQNELPRVLVSLKERVLELIWNIDLNQVKPIKIFYYSIHLKSFNMLMRHVNPQKEKSNIAAF